MRQVFVAPIRRPAGVVEKVEVKEEPEAITAEVGG
jgi:hypothetical protein